MLRAECEAILAERVTAGEADPQYQRQGIGAQVMDTLEDAARAAGQRIVHLDVSLPSRRFYESRGYSRMESCSIDVGEGQRLDYWTAQKELRDCEF